MNKLIGLIMSAIMSFGLSGGVVDTVEIPENSQFEVHYIDVGQADSALIICDGETMMIDGGNVADSNVVAAYLKKNNIDELDYVICSHAHEDHVGGLSGALSVADVNNVYAPKTELDTKAYQNFKKKVKQQKLKIKNPSSGDTVLLGSSRVEFLGPINEKGKDTNNTSIVLKITYGATSFLFTGDAEIEEEKEILESGVDLKSTVLKVGHHGSSTSTSYSFLREVMPLYGVVSVGKDNSYGHPSEDTLSRLSDAGVEIFRTDLNGDIVMKSDGENISVITDK